MPFMAEGPPMSWKHLKSVFEHSRTKGPDRAILLALAFRASERDRPADHVREGECFPSLKTIAKDSGFARGTVAERLRGIACLGEITIQSRGYKKHDARANLYRITLPVPGSDRPGAGLTGDTHSPGAGPEIVRQPDLRSSESRTSDSPGARPEPKENVELNRETKGKTRDRIVIDDYSDILTRKHDPVAVALAVTEEKRGGQAEGGFRKKLSSTQALYGADEGERLFREAIAELWGECKPGADRIDRPGAILHGKLNRLIERGHKMAKQSAGPETVPAARLKSRQVAECSR